MDATLVPYVSGEKFETALSVRFTPAGPVLHRTEQLLKLAKGKRVIHVGCCDHLESLRERLETGTWLHGAMTEVAEVCLGVDINEAAVAASREATGLDNIIYGDISKSGIDQISANRWDMVVLADVLEHIPNPTAFLQGLVENYGHMIDSIVVSVPNSMRLGTIKWALQSRELANTDHQCEFSPFTLAKTLASANIYFDDIYFGYFTQETGLRRWVFKKFPYLCHNMIVQAKIGAHRS